MCRSACMDQPVVFHSYLQDVRDGWPQFYGVRRV
jgi:hypothetical protein